MQPLVVDHQSWRPAARHLKLHVSRQWWIRHRAATSGEIPPLDLRSYVCHERGREFGCR